MDLSSGTTSCLRTRSVHGVVMGGPQSHATSGSAQVSCTRRMHLSDAGYCPIAQRHSQDLSKRQSVESLLGICGRRGLERTVGGRAKSKTLTWQQGRSCLSACL